MSGYVQNVKNTRQLLETPTKKWKIILTSGQDTLDTLGQVNIRRGIFQGDSLSPMLFVLALIPLTTILKDINCGYLLSNGRGRIKHLLFMDDLKQYGKDLREMESLVQTVRVFSKDIGMEFGIEKCAMTKMARGWIIQLEGIEFANSEKIRSLEEAERYIYLGIIQSDKEKKMQK